MIFNGLLAQAKDMYEQNCFICHGLHSVKEYTAESRAHQMIIKV